MGKFINRKELSENFSKTTGEALEIGELGFINIRKLSGMDRNILLIKLNNTMNYEDISRLIKTDETNAEENIQLDKDIPAIYNFFVQTLIMGIADEDGEPMFIPGDEELITQTFSMEEIQLIFDAIMFRNRIMEKNVEQEIKN